MATVNFYSKEQMDASVGTSDDTASSSGTLWARLKNLVTRMTTAETNISNKQDTLVSASNIKTINGSSILGSGNLVVSGSGVTAYTNSYSISSGMTISTISGYIKTEYDNGHINESTVVGLNINGNFTVGDTSGTALIIGQDTKTRVLDLTSTKLKLSLDNPDAVIYGGNTHVRVLYIEWWFVTSLFTITYVDSSGNASSVSSANGFNATSQSMSVYTLE